MSIGRRLFDAGESLCNESAAVQTEGARELTFPRFRNGAIIVDPAGALVPNSPTDSLTLFGTVDEPVDRFRTAVGVGFSFSRLEAVDRKKLRPRIDRRPSGDGSAFSPLEEASPTISFDDLREKKGIPEGVRRGLRRDDLERPGLMATTEGVDSEALD